MAEATVTWLKEGIFVGTDGTKHSVVLSKYGEDGGVGMKPSELLLVSLASCTAVDVVSILTKMRISLSELEIKVEGEQDGEPPWQYRKIHLTYRVKGEGCTDAAVERAIELSESKYCSVAASLRGQVEIGHSYEILNNDGAGGE
ncbi:MAG: OsmC family peroxiredoxin [Anaerolineales bacterium]|nr:OsmC family peroxiredoxin [Anaerolineales bacterium]